MKFLLNMVKWSVGSHPQGLGTLMIGVAALIALYQTSSILDNVLKIQDQANKISSAIDLLASQLKENKAVQTVDSSQSLKNPNSTIEDIKNAIQIIPAQPFTKGSSIYLPSEKFDKTVEMLHKAKTPERRKAILQDSLEYVIRPAGK